MSEIPAERATSVLFIGNSYTGGWGDDTGAEAGGACGMMQSFAWARGRRVNAHASLCGGTALHEHLADGSRVADALALARWDFVVLQEYSTLPTRKGDGTHGTVEDFFTAVRSFEKLIHARHGDAQIVLFQTWARRDGDNMYPKYIPDPAAMYADLRRNYRSAAEMIGAVVAPVGDAWERVTRERPKFQLHAEDLNHASAAGSYLSALVLFGTIFVDDPRGLPPLVGLSGDDAAYLQGIAWAVVEPHLEQR